MDSKAPVSRNKWTAGVSKMKRKMKMPQIQTTSSKSAIKLMTHLFQSGQYEKCLEFIDGDTRCNDEILKKILMAACWTFMGINHEKVVETLNEIIAEDPRNSHAHYELGHNFYLRGQLEQCINPLTRALELYPTTMTRALLYINNASKILSLIKNAKKETAAGNFSKAIEVLATASLVDPDNNAVQKRIIEISDEFLVELLNNPQKDVKFNSNNFEDTEQPHLQNVKQEMSAIDWHLKGMKNYFLGRLKQSLVEFLNALKSDENNMKVQEITRKAARLVELMENATTKMKLKMYDEAIEILSTALEVDPDNKRILQAIYFQRAACKFNMGKANEAFADYLQFEALQNMTGMIMDGIIF